MSAKYVPFQCCSETEKNYVRIQVTSKIDLPVNDGEEVACGAGAYIARSEARCQNSPYT
jgi:hypothetical protein